MIFDVKKIQVKDFDGNAYPIELSKPLGNLLYFTSKTIDWQDISRSIHSGTPVELQEQDLRFIEAFVMQDAVDMIFPIKQAISDYIKELLTNKTQ